MSFEKDLSGLLAYYIEKEPVTELLKALDDTSTLLVLGSLLKPVMCIDAVKDLNQYRLGIVDALNVQALDSNTNIKKMAEMLLSKRFEEGTTEIIHKIRLDYNQDLYLNSNSLWQDVQEH